MSQTLLKLSFRNFTQQWKHTFIYILASVSAVLIKPLGGNQHSLLLMCFSLNPDG